MGAEGFGSLADAAHYIIFGGVLTLKLDLLSAQQNSSTEEPHLNRV